MYNIENYLTYSEEYKIYDILDNPFLTELGNLSFNTVVSREGRDLDQLAKDYYGTELLWWVIAYYNDVITPLNFDKEEIKIPDFSKVEELFIKYK